MIKSLPVKLTVEELRSVADDLAASCVEQDRIREEKAEVTKTYNDGLKDEARKISRLARLLRERQEFRDVPCTERFVFETNTCEVYRDDTGERVEVRAMTAEEREAQSQADLLSGRMEWKSPVEKQ